MLIPARDPTRVAQRYESSASPPRTAARRAPSTLYLQSSPFGPATTYFSAPVPRPDPCDPENALPVCRPKSRMYTVRLARLLWHRYRRSASGGTAVRLREYCTRQWSVYVRFVRDYSEERAGARSPWLAAALPGISTGSASGRVSGCGAEREREWGTTTFAEIQSNRFITASAPAGDAVRLFSDLQALAGDYYQRSTYWMRMLRVPLVASFTILSASAARCLDVVYTLIPAFLSSITLRFCRTDMDNGDDFLKTTLGEVSGVTPAERGRRHAQRWFEGEGMASRRRESPCVCCKYWLQGPFSSSRANHTTLSTREFEPSSPVSPSPPPSPSRYAFPATSCPLRCICILRIFTIPDNTSLHVAPFAIVTRHWTQHVRVTYLLLEHPPALALVALAVASHKSGTLAERSRDAVFSGTRYVLRTVEDTLRLSYGENTVPAPRCLRGSGARSDMRERRLYKDALIS
ncbi:hypothetical protein MSAN_02362300 [Mycena sanguinolenta]|uniref:Uncharacterized protein n=1 Tax=Mycena sanguinolenta TaxID=230812 RepID=A0A8H6X5H4_9AGAR|nr:hypothetical protein MSAN_02362300 [Mycena sanguinolenta]